MHLVADAQRKGNFVRFRKSRVELLVSTDPNERVLEFFSVSSAFSAFHGSLTGPLLFQKQDAVGGTKLNAEDTEAQRKSLVLRRSFQSTTSS